MRSPGHQLALLALLLATPACRPKATLANVTFGTAYVSSRTKTTNLGELDEPLLAGERGMISFRIDPPSTVSCMPALAKLSATANGSTMKIESAGGAHDEYPLGPSHGPTKQLVCDPIRFTVAREVIKVGDGGKVTFEVTDGETTMQFVWAHLFDHRTVALVEHEPTLKVGEHITIRWSPIDDKFMGTAQVRACLEPGPAVHGCPKSLNGSQCVDAHVEGKMIDFDVPAEWSCMTSGGLWVSGVSPRATNPVCDPRVAGCRADLVPAVQPLDVRVATDKP